jgi:hypothetical protein
MLKSIVKAGSLIFTQSRIIQYVKEFVSFNLNLLYYRLL